MKRTTRKQTGGVAASGSDRLFKLLIIIASIILVIMIMVFCYCIRQTYYTYTSSANDILRSIQNGRYESAISDRNYNIANGLTVQENRDFEVPYALVDYYEAQFLYTQYTKAAENTADKKIKSEILKKAEEYRSIMEEAKTHTGDLAFMTEDIDKIFG